MPRSVGVRQLKAYKAATYKGFSAAAERSTNHIDLKGGGDMAERSDENLKGGRDGKDGKKIKERAVETTVIKPRTGWFDIDPVELFRYRDLVALFVKKNFATRYKQTVLGPLWIIISPLLTTAVSTIVFGNIAKIPSSGIPYFLFYMCGNVMWSFFSSSLFQASSTFVSNARLFGKVYFPRLAVPVSSVITGMFDFLIQFVMFAGFLVYYAACGVRISLNPAALMTPLLLLQTAILALGFGMIVSSLTAKYRDLSVVVNLGVSLWMYVTPVIYSAESLPAEYKTLCMLNPMSPIIEIMRYAFFGVGSFPTAFWLISLAVTAAVFVLGMIIFSRVEKTFADTV